MSKHEVELANLLIGIDVYLIMMITYMLITR